MKRAEIFAWLVVLAAAAALGAASATSFVIPSLATFIFWLTLRILADLLPVALGFGSEVTMAFPLMVAIAIVFDPPVAMVIAGLGALDQREFRGEIPLWRSLFNRAEFMLATGAMAALIEMAPADVLARSDGPIGISPIALAFIAAGALSFVIVNLGLVTIIMHLYLSIPLNKAVDILIPKPAVGFFLSQAVLGGLGVATAAVYGRIGPFVAAFLVPLLFARLSILGARAQQELSERVRKQQEALLDATERVFQEREDERHRIAGEIHDGSLQLLAAASYGFGNANEFLKAGRADKAEEAMMGAREAVDAAIKALRESLVDLRRSSVEQGGLMDTVRRFADQVAVLWGTEVVIEGQIKNEPPIPVALAAFQILQEGLTNAMKHARGGPVTVKIGDEDGMVHIVVEDRGPGFDPETEVGSGHVGMRLMRERAARVGGRIELDTSPSSGTRLEAILPGGVAQ
jgi:signal transduction histidine kinase